jgi:hypothetical protein
VFFGQCDTFSKQAKSSIFCNHPNENSQLKNILVVLQNLSGRASEKFAILRGFLVQFLRSYVIFWAFVGWVKGCVVVV